MEIHDLFRTHHTEISLVAGPALAWLISRLPRAHAFIKVVLFCTCMFFLVGLWGLMLNAWLIFGVLVFYAIKRRWALGPLRYMALSIAVLLTGAALAFYGYLLFTKPGEFFANLRNPLMYVYVLPGMLAFFLAGRIQEVRAGVCDNAA